MSLPDVLQYSDYRVFLKEFYDTHKAVNANFSYRYLSLKAGINSSAFYKYIIEGKRNLTKTTLLKTCLALKLKDQEAEYFENLVFFNQAKTIKEKNLYFDKLTKLRGIYDQRKVAQNQFAFYEEWYHSAIREMLECMAFTGDFTRLARSLTPAISSKQAEESLALLVRLGMVKKNAQGRWRQSDSVLTTGGQIDANVVVEFQKKMLKLALEAFDKTKPEKRLMSSTTFAVSGDTLDLFKKKIRQLKSELLELARLDGNASQVFQLNLNLFPLSIEKGRKS